MSTPLGKVIADFQTQFSTKVVQTNTTGTLASVIDVDGNTIPSATYFFTLDNDNSRKEYIFCTLDNTNGNISNVQSVSRQGVLSAGFTRTHNVGASVELTDFSTLYILNEMLKGTIALDGSNPLNYDTHPTFTSNTQLADKKYVDDTFTGSVGTATTTNFGTTKISVAPAITNDPIAVGVNDPVLAGSSGTPSSTNPFITENDTTNFATYTGTTISFTASTKTIADSANGLGIFRAGDTITVSGSVSNNANYTIVSVLAGAIVVSQTLINEVAGASTTIIAATGNKVVRLVNGVLPQAAVGNVITLPAAEVINNRDAVISGIYQSDGGVTLDTTASGNGSVGTTGGTGSYSITVASNTNRALIVFVEGDTGGGATTVTANGNAMTLYTDTQISGFRLRGFVLFAPPTGSVSIVITFPNTGSAYTWSSIAYSHYNTSQSLPDSYGTTHAGNPSTASQTIAVVHNGSVAVSCFAAWSSSATVPTITANAFNNNVTVNVSSYPVIISGDSGLIYPSGNTVISGIANGVGSIGAVSTIVLAPITAVSTDYAMQADTLNLANIANLTRYKGFAGFALNAASVAGQPVQVQIGQVVNGLAGLIPGQQYYLSDTPGLISLAAGTNTRKVGISLTATTLLITNIW